MAAIANLPIADLPPIHVLVVERAGILTAKGRAHRVTELDGNAVMLPLYVLGRDLYRYEYTYEGSA